MALRLSKKQRIHLFLLVSFLIQCLVEVENNFMDRLVAGMLGVVCACYLQGDDAEEIPTTAFPSTWLVLGFTLPWNPLIPVHWRVPLCRVGAPCAIVLFHHVLRRRYRLFQGLIDKLSHAGPYTFQVYIWHHVVYGWAGKSLLPYLTNDVFVYQVVCIPLVWAIVGAISVLMYKYVESPVAGYVKVKYINNHTRRNPTKEILSFDVDLQRE